MKSTESIDQAATTGGLPPVGIDQNSIPDQRRRRLVRGAVAVAPLVLTLRSGALAAASCTGARVVSTTTGEFSGAATDVCVPEATVCGGHPFLGDTKIVTAAQLKVPVSTTNGGTTYHCDKPGGGFYTGNVAILSATSATSIVAG